MFRQILRVRTLARCKGIAKCHGKGRRRSVRQHEQKQTYPHYPHRCMASAVKTIDNLDCSIPTALRPITGNSWQHDRHPDSRPGQCLQSKADVPLARPAPCVRSINSETPPSVCLQLVHLPHAWRCE
eukprot:6053975-Pleurochrysis_carterae.AAC.5